MEQRNRSCICLIRVVYVSEAFRLKRLFSVCHPYNTCRTMRVKGYMHYLFAKFMSARDQSNHSHNIHICSLERTLLGKQHRSANGVPIIRSLLSAGSFSCGLFNSGQYLDYIAPNGRMADELKGFGRKRLWPNQATTPECLEGMRKTTETFQASRCPGRVPTERYSYNLLGSSRVLSSAKDKTVIGQVPSELILSSNLYVGIPRSHQGFRHFCVPFFSMSVTCSDHFILLHTVIAVICQVTRKNYESLRYVNFFSLLLLNFSWVQIFSTFCSQTSSQ
jgi:hypothetical protein